MEPAEAALMVLQLVAWSAFFSSLTVRSTTETSGVGTRKAIPVNFPFSSGITLPTALAAPVAAGMMFWAAPRPPRQSLPLGPSTVFWVAVVAWTVVIKPSEILKLSWMILARGARQLVVQEAFETTVKFLSYLSSLTPITNIGASAEGAEMITFLAPPLVWTMALSLVVNTPVDSTMYSAPALAQLMAAGSRSLNTVIFIPFTYRNLPSSFTSPLNLPWVESYLNM